MWLGFLEGQHGFEQFMNQIEGEPYSSLYPIFYLLFCWTACCLLSNNKIALWYQNRRVHHWCSKKDWSDFIEISRVCHIWMYLHVFYFWRERTSWISFTVVFSMCFQRISKLFGEIVWQRAGMMNEYSGEKKGQRNQ